MHSSRTTWVLLEKHALFYRVSVLVRSGAEPPQVKLLMEKLRPVCHGLSVCGAGGGGFVACITKRPGDEVCTGTLAVVADGDGHLPMQWVAWSS